MMSFIPYHTPTAITHCRLNRLSHTIDWKSPMSILGMSGYEIYIFLEKMAKLFANGGDPDSAASDLGLHSLPLLGVSRLQWVKGNGYTFKRQPFCNCFCLFWKGVYSKSKDLVLMEEMLPRVDLFSEVPCTGNQTNWKLKFVSLVKWWQIYQVLCIFIQIPWVRTA